MIHLLVAKKALTMGTWVLDQQGLLKMRKAAERDSRWEFLCNPPLIAFLLFESVLQVNKPTGHGSELWMIVVKEMAFFK